MRVRFFARVVLVTACLTSCLTVVANARTGVSVASGYGAAHIVPLRLGLQREFEKQWRTESTWPITGYWEGSLYSMHGKKGPLPNSHKQLNAGALAAVVRFNRALCTTVGWPYVELGIGLSLLTQKEIGGRNLGMHFQFEDRFGIGVRFGENREYDFGYKAVHFSNAYLGSVNHGINLHLLTIGYWFK
ncbi:MAG TPA: acyloxyacyl hydrolase [Gammaproteobacteria bacterium]|nr:acyloxyacyl hydrolase [Gammaproteobacteria bacterium]